MRKLWTKKEIELLKDLYPDHNTRKIAELLNRSYSSVAGMSSVMGIKKSEQFFKNEKSGRLTGMEGQSYRFRKGFTPWNKGKKMPEEIYKKCAVTMFKKGNKPHNTKTDNAISIRKDSTNRPYQYIRISEGIWQELHRYIWEQNNGPVPEGQNIIFRDGNTMNCQLENLTIVSNAELMQLNTIHRYPHEVKVTIRALSKLKRTIKKHEKQH